MTAEEKYEHACRLAETALRINEVLLVVAQAAKAEHDERCGCGGQVCELGKALKGLKL